MSHLGQCLTRPGKIGQTTNALDKHPIAETWGRSKTGGEGALCFRKVTAAAMWRMDSRQAGLDIETWLEGYCNKHWITWL